MIKIIDNIAYLLDEEKKCATVTKNLVPYSGAVVVPAVITGYKMFAMLKDIQADQKILKVDNLKVQLLQMMQHDPNNRVAITGLHDAYVAQGGNSYVNVEYEKWAAKYNKPRKGKK